METSHVVQNRKIPKSRIGKRQIATFLEPELVEAIHRFSEENGITLQHVMGMAINHQYAMCRFPISVKEETGRLVRRKLYRARIRGKSEHDEARPPRCRYNTRALIG